MEAYKSTCDNCGSSYSWAGYKTGLGKTEEQLQQMQKKHHICRSCGSANLKTEVDRESTMGRVFGTQEDLLIQTIGEFISKRTDKS